MKYLKRVGMLLLAFTFSLNAQTFSASGDSRNQASFESNAPLEDIVGISNSLETMLMINPADITKSPKGKVRIDLRELKTGISLRDEHLKSSNWLDTEKYPYAAFMLKSITDASSDKLEDGKKVKATFNGIFTVHGVSKEISAPGEITYFKETGMTKKKMKGNLLKTKASFNIKLSDFGINIPDMVVGKVDENIKVSVGFIASDANASMGNPCGDCNPCGMKIMGEMDKMGKNNPCGMNKAKCNPCGGLK